MAELKTKPTEISVLQFIESIDDEVKKKDCFYLYDLMTKVSGSEPVMWSGSIVGFGDWHYKYKSGREGHWFVMGFSPRKQNLTIYIMDGFAGHSALIDQLGKHKTGKSCLYVKKLADIDLTVLKKLVEESYAHFKKSHK